MCGADSARRVYFAQVQPELAKLLELKARLSEVADGDPTGSKFVLKCPKVSK